MLLFQNALRQRAWGVAREHRHDTLDDDRSAIELRCHQVHRHSTDLHAMLDRLSLSLESWERRKQRWMNVENAVGERVDERCADQTHETGETHEANISGAQLVREGLIVGFARWRRSVRKADGLETCMPRALEAARILSIRDDDRYRSVERADRDCIDQRLQIAAATRDEDAKPAVHRTFE